ncbi:MAG: UDP-N-acetylmuramate--L-alanine ligase [Chlamydiales bacterium]
MDKSKQYHFIGIGGIGMSALARILLEKKYLISGSDISFSQNISELIKQGAIFQQGHSAKYISPQHTVIFSSGIKEGNPELLAARALNCRIMHRSQLLAELMQGHRSFACAGTHGKTTTASLLNAVLTEGGLDPTFAIGGMVQGVNGRIGQGNFFVMEADESDGSFLNYRPEGGIITNIESEHIHYYKTIESLYRAFEDFINRFQNTEHLFYYGDDLELKKLMGNKGISYGFSPDCLLQIYNFKQEGWKIYFDFNFQEHVYKQVEVSLIGEHNALNAAGIFGLALRLGVQEEKIRIALAKFSGIERRCQKRTENNSVLYLDDYAHHPTEIAKTLKSIKMAIEERRLVVLFQPHRYTRTRDQMQKLGKAFDMADLVYIDEIDPANEEKIEGINSDKLIQEIRAVSNVPCFPSKDFTPLMPHDVFITMGAGKVNHIHDRSSPSRKLTLGLVFGGVSCEHEISLLSARFVAASLDRDLYDIQYFGIDKKGDWITGNQAKTILETETIVASPECRPIFQIFKEFALCDLFLPILHGTYGEDGKIQGFFEMLGKPYIGPDQCASSLSMNKVLTKQIVASSGIPVLKDLSFSYVEWQQEKTSILNKIQQFPVYVKPIHLGSSIGISFVKEQKELENAIDLAFQFDYEIMIEEGKSGCRELEFPVIGNTQGFRIIVANPGEKLGQGEFIDYDKKYLHPIPTTLHPNLDPILLEKGKALTEAAYRAVRCSGMTRIDFLLDKAGNYWFFEMNPIPGLQKFSLFPKLWNETQFTPKKLFNHLIILALARKRQQDRHFKCLENF